MLGFPGISDPVQKAVFPGSWLMDSVLNEWMRQRSSATVERCGSSSLMKTPLLPCWLKLNFDGTMSFSLPSVMAVTRCPLLMDSGSLVLYSLWRLGLWSNRSIWLGAPAMKRKMILFALGV